MPESVNFNLQKVCSMSCNITVSVSDDFAKEAKRLAKKYPSFKQDYKEFLESIKNNPLQGDEKSLSKILDENALEYLASGKGFILDRLRLDILTIIFTRIFNYNLSVISV